MKNLIKLFIVFMLIIIVNVSFPNYEQSDWVPRWWLGTWTLQNETVDTLYSGYSGQVTFFRNELVIDSGRFAAAGIIHNSESTICMKHTAPISYKFIGGQYIYVFWNGIDSQGRTYPQNAMLTIVKRRGNRITIIGQGGCGSMGVPRISYLKKLY